MLPGAAAGLSVLIPVYQRAVGELVRALRAQASRWPGPVEILLLDDCSSEEFRQLNQPLAALPGVRYRELPQNTGRAAIRHFRHRTIGHFIGVGAEEFAAAEAVCGSTGEAIQKFSGCRMSPLGAMPPSMLQRTIAEFQLGDPTSPADAWRPWKRRNRSQRLQPEG